MRRVTEWLAGLAMVLGCCSGALSQTRERGKVPSESTWNLDDIFSSDDAWTAALQKTAAESAQIATFSGKLSQSAGQLLTCLQLDTCFRKEFARLTCYASMKSDQDTRVAKYMGFKQQITATATAYSAQSSFIGPEVAKMDLATLEGFLKQEVGLKTYEFMLRDILRTKTHRLLPENEKLLAETAVLAGAPTTTYKVFANAEFPFPEVTLSDGTKALLNQAGFGRYRTAPNRGDRRLVFDTFFAAWGRYRGTCGTLLSAHCDADVFNARARRYESALQAALDENNIPLAVYQTLITNVHRNLPTFHRYLRLRQRLLGVNQLAYSDMYAPTVPAVDLEYAYPKAVELVVESLAPLGPDYVRDLKTACSSRWIDVYPTPGKRAGAYSNGGVYDVHPYILLNYNGKYDDVSTLAHELGHTLHSFYSNKTQPYPLADYATFVAEVASTLNEALLLQKMLDTVTDERLKLSLLVSYLDGARATLFRQTQFAEFELAIHTKIENREPLTGDELTKMYGDILRRYYGHDQGVCRIEEAYCNEWAYVPHFVNYTYYVYQYATSFTASTCLAERIWANQPNAVADVMKFLSAGGSAYPIDILKRAGVNMLSPEPFDRTMARMNRVMDEIEKLLEK